MNKIIIIIIIIIIMSYLVISRIGEKSFNTARLNADPDLYPDHLIGRPKHRQTRGESLLCKTTKSIEAIVVESRARTDRLYQMY